MTGEIVMRETTLEEGSTGSFHRSYSFFWYLFFWADGVLGMGAPF